MSILLFNNVMVIITVQVDCNNLSHVRCSKTQLLPRCAKTWWIVRKLSKVKFNDFDWVYHCYNELYILIPFLPCGDWTNLSNIDRQVSGRATTCKGRGRESHKLRRFSYESGNSVGVCFSRFCRQSGQIFGKATDLARLVKSQPCFFGHMLYHLTTTPYWKSRLIL